MDFLLREWRPDDAPNAAKHADNAKIARNLRDVFPHPYGLKDAEQYINSCLCASRESSICLAIEIDGGAAGSIGAFRMDDVYQKSAELGYWLGEEYWSRGIMSAAVAQICQKAFTRWDIVRIFAEPFSGNIGSRRVLEKNGFLLEGVMKNGVFKNGELLDYCMYALLRPDISAL